MIFDTSIWIYFSISILNKRSMLLKEYLENDIKVNLCPPILQEILQGCRDIDQFSGLKYLLSNLENLISDHYVMSIKAAEIYFTLRKKSIIIRKPNEFLIAAHALKFDVPVVHNDKDFDAIATIFPLKIYHPKEL